MYQAPGASAAPNQQMTMGFGSPASLGNYYQQYTQPAAYKQFTAPSGFGSVNTGVNVQSPTLPPGALANLMGQPHTSIPNQYGQQGSWSPDASRQLNNLYGQQLYGNNVQAGTNLSNLFNQQNAANNLNLGNLQGQLAMQGMGQGADSQLFNWNQNLDLSNLLRGFAGNMFGNAFGLMGGL